MPPDPAIVSLARSTAVQLLLDPALVCAVIEQESDWNQYAIRAEPAFDARYVQPLHLTPTEEWARSISWGLMQVMGEVAREHGYAGAFPMLCAPSVGIVIGCQVLRSKLDKAGGNVKEALVAWNGGANASYPEEVIARMKNYL